MCNKQFNFFQQKKLEFAQIARGDPELTVLIFIYIQSLKGVTIKRTETTTKITRGGNLGTVQLVVLQKGLGWPLYLCPDRVGLTATVKCLF